MICILCSEVTPSWPSRVTITLVLTLAPPPPFTVSRAETRRATNAPRPAPRPAAPRDPVKPEEGG